MFNNAKRLLKLWMYGWIEFVCLFPIFLFVGVRSNNDVIYWMLLFPSVFLLGLIITEIAKNRSKGLYIIVSAIIAIIIPLTIHASPLMNLFTIIFVFLFTYRGTLYGLNGSDNVFFTLYSWLSLAGYFVFYFVFRIVDGMYIYLDHLTWSGLILIIVTLLITNKRQLQHAALANESKDVLPKFLLWQNRVGIILTVLIIILLVNFRVVQEILFKVVYFLFAGFAWLMSLIDSEEITQPDSTLPEMEIPNFGEEAEQSLLAFIIERIFIIIATIITIAVLILLILYVIKNIYRWMKKNFPKVIDYLNKIITGNPKEEYPIYIDEKEVTMDWEAWKRSKQEEAKLLLKRLFKRERDWKDLKSNQERIRFLYQRLVLKQIKEGFSYQPSQTPNEVINELIKRDSHNKELLDAFASAYAKTRYNDEVVPDELVIAIKDYVEQK